MKAFPSTYDMYVAGGHASSLHRGDLAQRCLKNGNARFAVDPNGSSGRSGINVVGHGDVIVGRFLGWRVATSHPCRGPRRPGQLTGKLGPILVSGKSLAAVQENLQQILRTQFHNVFADVSLARLRTIRGLMKWANGHQSRRLRHQFRFPHH